MKILWLASWYPNPYEPYNGDFIQRHAKAVAQQVSINIIHILQHGKVSKNEEIESDENGFKELFYAFEFTPTGIPFLDKLVYNFKYTVFYKKILDRYIQHYGLPDLVHVHVPVKAGLIALYLKRKYRIPYIVSEQSSHYETASPYYFFNRSKYYQSNCRKIFSGAVAVSNVSATIGEILMKIFSIKNYRTIHNLVDTAKFQYHKKETGSKIRLIHVSALGEQKNPHGIIKALSILKEKTTNWECTICGPANQNLKDYASQLHIDDYIKFTGEIPYDKVADYMKQSDVFLLFSNHENFPCVIVEALCCGLPVVSTTAGGIAEAVNSSNGILVPVGDVEEFSNALCSMIFNFESYKPQQISDDATKKYNQNVIAYQFVNLYKSVLGR